MTFYHIFTFVNNNKKSDSLSHPHLQWITHCDNLRRFQCARTGTTSILRYRYIPNPIMLAFILVSDEVVLVCCPSVILTDKKKCCFQDVCDALEESSWSEWTCL
jgi:hypothetical protein